MENETFIAEVQDLSRMNQPFLQKSVDGKKHVIIVVVEGADGVGKTTVAKRIAEVLKLKYIHTTAPKDYQTAKDECFDLIHTQDAVLDRSWVGEFVYPQLFRNYTADYFNELEAAIKTTGIRILYIMLFRAQPFNSQEYSMQHEQIQMSFINMFNKIKSGEKYIFNVDNFNIHGDVESSMKHELDTIAVFASNWRMNQPVIKPFTNDYRYTLFNPSFRTVNGIMKQHKTCTCGHSKAHKDTHYYKNTDEITWGSGNMDAQAVWVGEAPGIHGCGTTGIPFYNDLSGTLLRNAMFYNRILETEIYMTNACKCNPEANKINMSYAMDDFNQHFNFELNQLKNDKKYVAIGRTAEQLMANNDMHPIYMPHPAWVLRNGQDFRYYKNLNIYM